MTASAPRLRDDEMARVAALHRYGILDTPREADFDEVVQMLASLCDAPISVINLIDKGRQWFKAEVGLGVRETPLDVSICAHAILQPGLFVVPDTFDDPRFRDNPLVAGDPRLRFYAGALLETEDGLPLGTVCVLDYKPRQLDHKQLTAIRLMAKQVMRQIELRHLLLKEGQIQADLRTAVAAKSELLRQNEILLHEVDHRVKNSLQLVMGLLALQAGRSSSPEAKRDLTEAQMRVSAIAAVHDQLNTFGSTDQIELAEFLPSLCNRIAATRPANVSAVTCAAGPAKVSAEAAISLGLIVNELLANAFKHAFEGRLDGTVTVIGTKTGSSYTLAVSDDGVGHAPDASTHQGAGTGILAALAARLGSRIENIPSPRGTSSQVSFPLAAVAPDRFAGG